MVLNIKFFVQPYYSPTNQTAYILIFSIARKVSSQYCVEVCVSTVFIVNLTILLLVIFNLLTHEIHVKGHAIVHRVINPTFQLCVIRLQGQVIQQNSEKANYIKSYNKILQLPKKVLFHLYTLSSLQSCNVLVFKY